MTASLIPPDKREAVDRALMAVFGSATMDDLTPVTAGLSGALVCKVVVSGKSALLRVQREVDALRDPARQYACMATAAEAGLAPSVLHADAEAGVVLVEFITTRPLSEHPGGGPGMIADIGALLARLQRTPVFPRLVDYFDGMEGVIADTWATGILGEALAADVLGAYRQVCAAYPKLGPEAWVSSHNDMNPSNILYDGVRLWLVDWEAAFAADPHVDPAMLANWFGLEGPGEALFLAAVFGEVDDERRARFRLMRQVCQMFVGCMMLNLVAASGSPQVTDLNGPSADEVRQGLRTGQVQMSQTSGQLAFAKAALRDLVTAVRGPGFAEAAAVLAAA